EDACQSIDQRAAASGFGRFEHLLFFPEEGCVLGVEPFVFVDELRMISPQAVDRRVEGRPERGGGGLEVFFCGGSQVSGESLPLARRVTLKIHGTLALPVQQSDRVAFAQHRAIRSNPATFWVMRPTDV